MKFETYAHKIVFDHHITFHEDQSNLILLKNKTIGKKYKTNIQNICKNQYIEAACCLIFQNTGIFLLWLGVYKEKILTKKMVVAYIWTKPKKYCRQKHFQRF